MTDRRESTPATTTYDKFPLRFKTHEIANHFDDRKPLNMCRTRGSVVDRVSRRGCRGVINLCLPIVTDINENEKTANLLGKDHNCFSMRNISLLLNFSYYFTQSSCTPHHL